MPNPMRSITVGFSLSLTHFLFVAMTFVWILPSAVQSQDRPRRVDRSSKKIPAPEATKLEAVKGTTFVSSVPGIEHMLQGNEPRDLKELKALQDQQSMVAEKINQVTVNLQHGSTQGSGVIISQDGYIFTAAHVAGKPNQKIKVTLYNGKSVEGITMGVDRNHDAGLVRILNPKMDDGQPWPNATLPAMSESAKAGVKVGQWCIAGGHPGGYLSDRPSVIRVGRILRISNSTLITDCSLIGGDSGGPLFDLQGKLIGIHSRIGVDFDDNMHVPMNVFFASWDRMANNEAWGTLPGFKPVIGVTSDPSNPKDRCLIGRVSKDGPASKAGIEPGDVIVRFNEVDIQNFDQLIEEVNATVPGERITVEIQRNGNRKILRMIVGVAGE